MVQNGFIKVLRSYTVDPQPTRPTNKFTSSGEDTLLTQQYSESALLFNTAMTFIPFVTLSYARTYITCTERFIIRGSPFPFASDTSMKAHFVIKKGAGVDNSEQFQRKIIKQSSKGYV